MMDIKGNLLQASVEGLKELYGVEVDPASLQVQVTSSDFTGDYTLVLFPLLKLKLGSPQEIGDKLGSYLAAGNYGVAGYEVVKGFLNLTLSNSYWLSFLEQVFAEPARIQQLSIGAAQKVMVEFSSPNTNKPLHLGHLRNNFLGDSVSRLLTNAGYAVVKANLVNDRGIHICKSMLAWQESGTLEKPSAELKGDHLVGKYYVAFETRLKAEAAELLEKNPGMDVEEARKRAPITQRVQEMLRKWEAGDPDVLALWREMNGWVYDGFEATYSRMGIAFDQMYYESQTYLLGKDVIDEGLQKGVFYQKPDGSVWIDLTEEGLDHKVLLRSDGTSVYMTQDLGTAELKYKDHHMNSSVYVVGNEQDYHFKVLFSILKRLGRPYANGLFHLSYGMVELPSGKMKSREGTVVDADELMEEVVQSAKAETHSRGKVESLTETELALLHETLGIGALKFYLLKVSPQKKMLFDPKESVSLQGDTGPFVQYTHARIQSLLEKAQQMGLQISGLDGVVLNPEEVAILRRLQQMPEVLNDAIRAYDPSGVTAYLLDLAKDYNRFYYAHPVLRESEPAVLSLRLSLSKLVASTLRHGMGLLGIAVPDRM